MAVVSSFTHDGDTLLPPSTVVNFTDTSTGSPNRWLWDFGDGGQSNLQDPSHEFVGEAPETFDVTLKAWLHGSDGGGAGMGTISGSARCTWKQIGGNHTLPPDQEAIFDAASFGTFSSSQKYVGNMIDTNASPSWRELIALRTQWSQTPSSNPLHVPIVRIPLLETDSFVNRTPRGLQGTVILKRSDPADWPNGFVQVASTSAVGFGRNVEFDLSPWAGVASWFMVTSTELRLIADEGDTQESGFIGFPVQSWDTNIASADDVDESTQQLIFGTPPIAAFSASPTIGFGPLSVQFQNLSTPAVGLPTTYSWRKRIHGSGDSFVEFSTAEDPSEDFTK